MEEREEIAVPNGWDLIDQLPNDLANEYLMDEAVCGMWGNKLFLVAMFDAAADNDSVELLRITKACIAKAGESEAAIDDWIRIYGDEHTTL